MFVEQLGKNDIRKLVIKLGLGRYIYHEFNKSLGLLEVDVKAKVVFEDEADPRCSWIYETIGFSDYDCEMVLSDYDCETVLSGEELKLYRKFMYEKFGLKYAETFLLGSEG